MTLNITVASEWITLQSSDFRLTASGTDEALSDCAQKQFVLHYGGWSGLLCYTGVAKWGEHDTAQWLTTLLTNAKGAQTPGQVLDRIKVAGDRWIRWVPARHQRHTFTLATYEAGHARIYVVSNFERGGGDQFGPLSEFKVFKIRPRAPRVITTGSGAITSDEETTLKGAIAAARTKEELLKLRQTLALTSRKAARRAQGTVSENCVAANLLPDGSGEAQVFGNLTEEYLPTLITRGVNTADSVALAKQDAKQKLGTDAYELVRLVGVTWTANAPNSTMLLVLRPLKNQTGTGWPD